MLVFHVNMSLKDRLEREFEQGEPKPLSKLLYALTFAGGQSGKVQHEIVERFFPGEPRNALTKIHIPSTTVGVPIIYGGVALGSKAAPEWINAVAPLLTSNGIPTDEVVFWLSMSAIAGTGITNIGRQIYTQRTGNAIRGFSPGSIFFQAVHEGASLAYRICPDSVKNGVNEALDFVSNLETRLIDAVGDGLNMLVPEWQRDVTSAQLLNTQRYSERK
uniref:Uncharacterized protein n=1 Tax=uncultured marine group II/III euryarchaeote KM3_83_G03 TaxID=1456522 RepID=A0A075HQL0_9EURY|nr:hypothetical protein [uncultured marine group II/III euryarchaeote KM3_83_G03]